MGNSARKLPNAPELNYNIAMDYERPLEAGGTMNVFVDYVYEGDHYKEVVNIPMLKITNKLLMQGSHGIFQMIKQAFHSGVKT